MSRFNDLHLKKNNIRQPRSLVQKRIAFDEWTFMKHDSHPTFHEEWIILVIQQAQSYAMGHPKRVRSIGQSKTKHQPAEKDRRWNSQKGA